MPTSRGVVSRIKVGDDFCFFDVLEDDGQTEVFILWWHFSDPPSAFLRVVETNQLTLLRDAVASTRRVGIDHDEGSAFVLNVQLSASVT